MGALTVQQNNTSLNPAGMSRMDCQPGDRIIVREISDPTITAAPSALAFDRPRLRFMRKYGEPVQSVTRGAVDSGSSSLTANASPWIVEIDLVQQAEIICPDFAAVEVYYPGTASLFRGAYQFAVLPPPATEYYESVSVRPGPRDYVLSQRVTSGATVTPPFLGIGFSAVCDLSGGPLLGTWNFGGGLSDGPLNVPAFARWNGASSIDLRCGAGGPILLTHTVRF